MAINAFLPSRDPETDSDIAIPDDLAIQLAQSGSINPNVANKACAVELATAAAATKLLLL